MMTDVCLVLMPYASPERPSLALSLLKACLHESGVKSSVLYPNLWFAEEIGLINDQIITNDRHLAGEWTFSGAAFPDFEPDHDEYLRTFFGDNAKWINSLWTLRWQAPEFVDRTAQAVLDLNPRIVGCSSTFQQHCASLALLRRIRQLDPRVITMMGGANCEDAMGVATHRAFPWVDFVCSGEADNLFPELCRKLLDTGRQLEPHELPYGVMGPCHRLNGYGATPRASVSNLNRLPIPDFSEYFHTLESSPLAEYISPALAIETSRGCWWGEKKHCTFCGLKDTGLIYRSKSPERVVQEFASLSERHGLRKFCVADNILDMSHVKTVLPQFEALETPYNIFYETKANLNRDQVQQYANAGIHWIQPGIESLHDAALRLMEKGNTTAMNIQLLKWAREFGIQVLWNFLICIPGESSEWYASVVKWLPLVYHLQPPFGVTPIAYFRFSPYHQRPAEYGLTLEPSKEHKYVYPLSLEMLRDLAYVFDDSNIGRESTISPGYEALKESVTQWKKQFRSNVPPVLSMTDDGDQSLLLVDTRPCATEKELRLEGLAYWVYLACDHAQTPQSLVKALRQQDGLVSWNDIQPVVEQLQARRVMLELAGKFLSLAVQGPVPSLPGRLEQPLGYVNLRQYLGDRKSGERPTRASFVLK